MQAYSQDLRERVAAACAKPGTKVARRFAISISFTNKLLRRQRTHKVAGLAEVAQKYVARLLYLPPYLPDFNPIEPAFSKLKTWLRTAQARTRDVLEYAIRPAAQWIKAADAENWFDHCGYHVH